MDIDIQSVINYLYGKLKLYDYRYKIIETCDDINILENDTFYISPDYFGTYCFLVCIEVKGQQMTCLINKKTLHYNKTKTILDQVSYFPIPFLFNDSAYKGTILDGVYYKSDVKGNIFIINDAYFLNGESLLDDKRQIKLIRIDQYIKQLRMSNECFEFIINISVEFKNIRTLIKNDIPSIDIPIKGISFNPDISGCKYIYLFDNDKQIKLCETPKICDDINYSPDDSLIKKQTSKPIIKKKTMIFEMRKTPVEDVYKLYLCKKVKDSLLKLVKIGIAYIPTSECSKLCRNFFEKESDKCLAVCTYNFSKDKWSPVELAQKNKYPDLVDE